MSTTTTTSSRNYTIRDLFYSLLLLLLSTASAVTTTCRNRYLWPFSSSSIWNTPIRQGAEFAHAHLYNETNPTSLRRPPANFHSDQDLLVLSLASDPSTPWIDDTGNFPGGCGEVEHNASQIMQHFPSSYTVDCTPNNNAAAVLKPDGRTLLQTQPLYRPSPGSPVISWYHSGVPQTYPWSVDILSDGALGAHGGSGLSSIGGTLRIGELLPGADPIRHALKLELWSKPYYFGGSPSLQNATKENGGRNQYVWPATGSDGGSNKPGASGGLYNGTNRWLAPGSLLALPRHFLNLNTTTVLGGRIKRAMTEYGGYLVDDTGSERGGAALCMEPGAMREVERSTSYNNNGDSSNGGSSNGGSSNGGSSNGGSSGVSFNITTPVTATGGSALASAVYKDLVLIFQHLHVVTNNGPESIGGGGAWPSDIPEVPEMCDPKPTKGVLHQIGSCTECMEQWCGDQKYDEDSVAVEAGYSFGVSLSSWGCQHVTKGMARVRNSVTRVVYAVDASPVISKISKP